MQENKRKTTERQQNYQCPYCKIFFVRHGNLERHIKNISCKVLKKQRENFERLKNGHFQQQNQIAQFQKFSNSDVAHKEALHSADSTALDLSPRATQHQIEAHPSQQAISTYNPQISRNTQNMSPIILPPSMLPFFLPTNPVARLLLLHELLATTPQSHKNALAAHLINSRLTANSNIPNFNSMPFNNDTFPMRLPVSTFSTPAVGQHIAQQSYFNHLSVSNGQFNYNNHHYHPACRCMSCQQKHISNQQQHFQDRNTTENILAIESGRRLLSRNHEVAENHGVHQQNYYVPDSDKYKMIVKPPSTQIPADYFQTNNDLRFHGSTTSNTVGQVTQGHNTNAIDMNVPHSASGTSDRETVEDLNDDVFSSSRKRNFEAIERNVQPPRKSIRMEINNNIEQNDKDCQNDNSAENPAGRMLNAPRYNQNWGTTNGNYASADTTQSRHQLPATSYTNPNAKIHSYTTKYSGGYAISNTQQPSTTNQSHYCNNYSSGSRNHRQQQNLHNEVLVYEPNSTNQENVSHAIFSSNQRNVRSFLPDPRNENKSNFEKNQEERNLVSHQNIPSALCYKNMNNTTNSFTSFSENRFAQAFQCPVSSTTQKNPGTSYDTTPSRNSSSVIVSNSPVTISETRKSTDSTHKVANSNQIGTITINPLYQQQNFNCNNIENSALTKGFETTYPSYHQRKIDPTLSEDKSLPNTIQDQLVSSINSTNLNKTDLLMSRETSNNHSRKYLPDFGTLKKATSSCHKNSNTPKLNFSANVPSSLDRDILNVNKLRNVNVEHEDVTISNKDSQNTASQIPTFNKKHLIGSHTSTVTSSLDDIPSVDLTQNGFDEIESTLSQQLKQNQIFSDSEEEPSNNLCQMIHAAEATLCQPISSHQVQSNNESRLENLLLKESSTLHNVQENREQAINNSVLKIKEENKLFHVVDIVGMNSIKIEDVDIMHENEKRLAVNDCSSKDSVQDTKFQIQFQLKEEKLEVSDTSLQE